jgi:hypothetical protein
MWSSGREVSYKVHLPVLFLYRGLLIIGDVILGFKKPLDIVKVGVTFDGKTVTGEGTDKAREIHLFSIQDILWDAAPSKGKAPAKKDDLPSTTENGSSSKRSSLPPTGSVGHNFLFAIRWPYVNFPPALPSHRSVVHTEYALRAFVQLANGDEITSHPLYVDFRPHIDPSITLKLNPKAQEKGDAIVKDEAGKVLGEATLSCTGEQGTIFGSDCTLNLNLLVRHSDAKHLPRKAKVEVCEVHKFLHDGTEKEQTFVLSHENISLPPELVKPHQETTIPLKVHIPVPEVDSRRGATGLPTLGICHLQVEYFVRISIPLNPSRFLPSGKQKMIQVGCPIVVGNVKPQEQKVTRKVPRLVVNEEGEGIWDSQSASSSLGRRKNVRTNIVEWSETSEIPRFLADGDVDEDDVCY